MRFLAALGMTTRPWDSIRKTPSVRLSCRALRLAMFRHDAATAAKYVCLSTPEETSAGITSNPDEETSQIPEWVNPAKRSRTRIFRNPPAHRDGLDHTIHERSREQADPQRPSSQVRGRYES